MSDGDSFYQKVRRETARLLGYEGTDNLPADQPTRLDLATALRLGLDDMQARLVRGESVDVSKMLAATQELSRLLPTPEPDPRREALPRGSGCEQLCWRRSRLTELTGKSPRSKCCGAKSPSYRLSLFTFAP